MRLLLDTHILVWALMEDPLLPDQAAMLINDDSNELFCSTISVWETAIKNAKRPDNFKMPCERLIYYCTENGIRELPLYFRHVDMYNTLSRSEKAPIHNDPFDKIMIAQAKTDNLFFVIHDSLIKYYDEPCILFV